MGNSASRTFTANGTWVAPAGVTSATVVTQYNVTPIIPMQSHFGTCAQDVFGNVYTFGDNSSGELGNNVSPVTTSEVSSPVLVVGNLSFVKMTSQYQTYIGLTTQGKAYSWGSNSTANLGDGTSVSKSSPVAVVGGITFVDIVYGAHNTGGGFGLLHAMGLTETGDAYAWGYNDSGQLGDGTVTQRNSPVKVLGGLTFAKLYAGSTGESYGLTTAGALYAWGNNNGGQLGVGNVVSRSSPVAVVGGLTFNQVFIGQYQNTTAGGFGTVFAIGTNGTTYAWGNNNNGQLALGDVTPRSSPVSILGGLTFTQIAADSNFAIGLTSSGTAYAWGSNANGQLGVGNTTPRSSPVAVLGSFSFSQVVVTSNGAFNSGTNPTSAYALGVTTAGVPYAWGINASGNLGLGDVTPRSSPVAVVGGLTFQSMAVGGIGQGVQYSYGYTTQGQVWSWGDNEFGQLGANISTATAAVSSPVSVVGGMAVKTQPILTTNIFTIVPNTSYAVNLSQPIPTFGGFGVGNYGIPSSITVYFEE